MSNKPQPLAGSSASEDDRAAALAARYGTARSSSRRTLWTTLLILGGAVFLAIIVWAGMSFSNAPVTWKDLGYSVKDSSEVEVSFTVSTEPGNATRCTVEALNSRYAQVGVLDVDIPPADVGTTRHTVTVSTQELAVTGIVDTCVVVEPEVP